MKLLSVCAALAILASANAYLTATPSEVEALVTPAVELEKRAKDVVIAKDYKKFQQLKASGSPSATPLKAWHRTIYSTQVEIVTPVVIAGVTFSAKPPATTNGLEPWISLNKDGSPKTIKPKMKNGQIKDASPTYGTWFQTATTIVYLKDELKAHNMKDDEVFEHEEFLPEDQTYLLLNPVIRCTPPLYKQKGVSKDLSPEPFCFPQDNAVLKKDQTYFVTWYHRFFDDEVEKVKLHLSYVRESARQKGLKKRSEVIQKGGRLGETSFFSSEWMPKEAGLFALTIQPEWFGEKDWYKKVVISLQPDTVEESDFNFLKNSVVVEIGKGVKVSKGHNEDLKKQEEKARLKALDEGYEIEEGLDYEKYIVMMTMPTCVLLAVLGMYIFLWLNRKSTDLGFLKKVKLNRKKIPFKKTPKYSELPQWDGPKAD